MEFNTINDFLKDYYNDEDIFFVGYKVRGENNSLDVDWWHKPHTLNNINTNKLTQLNNYSKDIYLSLNTFKDVAKGRFEHNLKDVRSIFFDIDEPKGDFKTTGDIVKNIVNHLGKPTYGLHTSENKYQLIYLLDRSDYDHSEVKKLSYTLTKHFHTDDTFDLARVFRAPNFINNKNGWNVKAKKNDIKFNLNHFYEVIKSNNIELLDYTIKEKKSKPKKVAAATTNDEMGNLLDDIYKEKELKNTHKKDFNYNLNNKYINTYNKQVDNCGGDKSRADLSFVRLLMYRKMSFSNAIKNLKECRNDLFDRHGHELPHYINSLENATSDILVETSFQSQKGRRRKKGGDF